MNRRWFDKLTMNKRSNMKKTTLIVLMAVALFTFAACDGGGDDEEAITCAPGSALVDGSCVGPVPNPNITCNVDSDCDAGLACLNGECKTSVVPECKVDADCGDGKLCDNGTCVQNGPPECVPDCAGKTCGDNGCGGSCGSCEDGFICNSAGLCTGGGGDPNEWCSTNDDCQAGEACIDGMCEKTACTSNCNGKQCGNDGCGGNCGECKMGDKCDETFHCTATGGGKDPGPTTCTPSCLMKECGSDGCGGSCTSRIDHGVDQSAAQ